MRPFLVYGGSSHKRKQYAVQVARQNNWLLVEVDKTKLLSKLRKPAVTSSLTGKPNIIFISGVEKLPEKTLDKLIKLADSSPHRFILSTSGIFKIPKPIRQQLHLIKVGETPPNKLFSVLQKLMTNTDRFSVYKSLLDKDINLDQVIFILKNNVWKAKNQAFSAVETCLRYLYKVNKKIIASILAFNFPPTKIPLTFSGEDRKLNKELEEFLEKLRKKYKLPKFESLEVYRMIKDILSRRLEFGTDLSQELRLTEKEQKFLGIKLEKPEPKQPAEVSSSNLQKWM